MKAKRRQELHTNTLADWLGEKIQGLKPYASWIVGAVIAVIVAGVVVSVRGARQTSELTEAWNEFTQAQTDGFKAASGGSAADLPDALKRLQRIADEFSDSSLGVFAKLSLADIHLESGRSQLRSNQVTAGEHFKKAAENYEAVCDAVEDPSIKDRAMFCLGKSYEWQGNFKQAKIAYEKVTGPFRNKAQDRLDQLSHGSAGSFYDKFAQWKPKPPPDAPDARYPELDLDDDGPQVTGEIDYRRYLDATAGGEDDMPLIDFLDKTARDDAARDDAAGDDAAGDEQTGENGDTTDDRDGGTTDEDDDSSDRTADEADSTPEATQRSDGDKPDSPADEPAKDPAQGTDAAESDE